MESTEPHGQLPTAAAFIYLEYGNYLRELNRLSDAQRYIRQGLDMGIARRIDGASLQDGFIYLARTKYAQHDFAACFKTFQEAERHLTSYYYIEGFSDPLDTWKAALTLSAIRANRDSVIVEEKRSLEDWISSQDINVRPEDAGRWRFCDRYGIAGPGAGHPGNTRWHKLGADTGIGGDVAQIYRLHLKFYDSRGILADQSFPL